MALPLQIQNVLQNAYLSRPNGWENFCFVCSTDWGNRIDMFQGYPVYYFQLLKEKNIHFVSNVYYNETNKLI